MQRRTIIIAALVIAVVAFAAPVEEVISFQGKLVEAGVPVDGTRSIDFKIYDVETGGVALWTESHASVTVAGGLFNVELGSAVSLASLDFTEQYWVGISVEGGTEISPRYKLTGTPYAMNDGDWVVDGFDTYTLDNRVGIGTDAPESKLHVKGLSGYIISENTGGSGILRIKGNGNSFLSYHVDGSSRFSIWCDNEKLHIRPQAIPYPESDKTFVVEGISGNIGIGTTTPGARLEVSGHIWQTGLGHSIFIGEGAGTNDDSTDNFNVAIGVDALNTNTSGYSNNAIGVNALYSNTTGYSNVANGFSSMYDNTEGHSNTAVGVLALTDNVDGNENTAIGLGALGFNSTGNQNTALGHTAGYNITTGSNNIMIGFETAAPVATGDYQLNIGDAICGDLSSGNIGIGNFSPNTKLFVDQTGTTDGLRVYNNSGEGNVRIMGSTNSDLYFSVGTDVAALEADVSGDLAFYRYDGSWHETMRILNSDGNVGIGTTSPTNKLDVMGGVLIGSPFTGNMAPSNGLMVAGNVCIGTTAPLYTLNVNGVSCIWSSDARVRISVTEVASPITNVYGINAEATKSGSTTNYGVYGTASGGSTNYGLYCSGDGAYTGTWTDVSDRKFKKNITPMTGILDKVLELNPVTYEMRADEYDFMGFSEGTEYGLIAQDLKEVFPELVKHGVHPGPEGGEAVEYDGIDYISLTSILIKGIQEQQELIEFQTNRIERLEREIENLKED